MSYEGLAASSFPDIPQLGRGITGSRDEELEVGGDSQAHAVSSVTQEHSLLLSCFYVPEGAAKEGREKPGCHSGWGPSQYNNLERGDDLPMDSLSGLIWTPT